MLDSPEKIDLFAKALSDGATNVELTQLFNCHERTVRDYKKNPLVKAAALKYIEDRVLRITRRTDSEIEQRLEDPADMTVDELLRVRKEFLGGALRLQTTGDAKDGQTINDTMEKLEGDPEFAAELQQLLAGKKE